MSGTRVTKILPAALVTAAGVPIRRIHDFTACGPSGCDVCRANDAGH